MKICIYYQSIQKPWGGANTFINNLKRYLSERRIQIVSDVNDDCDLVLFNGAYKAPGKILSLSEIDAIRRYGYSSWFRRLFSPGRRLPIVHRFDGLRRVYANLKNTMDDIQLKGAARAHRIIFQSTYACGLFKEHGYQGQNHTVIHNGVDQNIFNCQGRNFWDGREELRLVASAWSYNLAKGQSLIADFSCQKNVSVDFVGQWPQQVPLKKVKCHSPCDQQSLAAVFKKAHAFLFPAQNEACSNVLLEALSSGLPVLYVDSGSNRELAGDYGVPIDALNIEKSIDHLRKNYARLIEAVTRDQASFSIAHAGRKYLEVFEDVISRVA